MGAAKGGGETGRGRSHYGQAGRWKGDGDDDNDDNDDDGGDDDGDDDGDGDHDDKTEHQPCHSEQHPIPLRLTV